ncbi:hypothetical protein JX265_004419 [Neoarthrinium moseri]|uniref:C4-dicarboxylate transporter/malic acid transport protein n=1 Tax=Neoarthrinium moseri TaxID=1658444 RepID=A0A9P9WQY5_9PEZI|nr:hypothetical protein JX265_004419 [Neoarthrinium moseri]
MSDEENPQPASSSPGTAAVGDHSSKSSRIERHRRAHGYTSARVSLKERLSHFTWSWFECTMSTGAIATLLGQQPYTFNGLVAVGKVFFVLDLALFVLFSALITARFLMHPSALKTSLHHPHEGHSHVSIYAFHELLLEALSYDIVTTYHGHHQSFFFGTFWVSLALILYEIQEYGVPATGPWLVRALEVLFWLYAACALLVVIFQYHVILDEEELPVRDCMPAWILPAYPFLVLGPLAAVLEYSQPQPAAMPILIGGLVFEGLGWSVAFIMYTVYFTRLINSKLPFESKRPGMFVAVGPAGYASTTLASRGMQAPIVIPPNYLGITSVPTGDLWKAFAVPAAMFVWLLGFWFFALATVSCLKGARAMHFTLNRWAFIFPNVGLTIGAISIANAIDSSGIKGLCSGLSVLLVAAWFIVAVFNIRGVWTREVLWPGVNEDIEDLEGWVMDGKERQD